MTTRYSPGDALIVTGDEGGYAHPFQPGQAVRLLEQAWAAPGTLAWVEDLTGLVGLVGLVDLAPAIDLTPEPAGECFGCSRAPLAPWERELLAETKPSVDVAVGKRPPASFRRVDQPGPESRPVRVGDWVRPKSVRPSGADLGLSCRVRVLGVQPGALTVSECDAGTLYHGASVNGCWVVRPTDVYLVP